MIAKTQSIILDGRDLGTVVFPDAELKYFLSTSIEKRIHNWEKGQISKFGYVDLDKKEKVRNDLLYRDEMDKTRSIAPLKKAADAIEINGDCYTISQIIEKIICDYKEMS